MEIKKTFVKKSGTKRLNEIEKKYSLISSHPSQDPTFANDLYLRATQLSDFAWQNPGLHHVLIPDNGDAGYYPYTSYHYVDETVYSSLWLAKAAQYFEPNMFLEWSENSKISLYRSIE